MEDQQAKLASKIKQNFMAQAMVIYLKANFGKIGLHYHVVDGRIVDISIEKEDANPKSDPVNQETDQQALYSHFYLFMYFEYIGYALLRAFVMNQLLGFRVLLLIGI